jgi:hypothetical protein
MGARSDRTCGEPPRASRMAKPPTVRPTYQSLGPKVRDWDRANRGHRSDRYAVVARMSVSADYEPPRSFCCQSVSRLLRPGCWRRVGPATRARPTSGLSVWERAVVPSGGAASNRYLPNTVLRLGLADCTALPSWDARGLSHRLRHHAR